MRRTVKRVRRQPVAAAVRPAPGDRRNGVLTAGGKIWRCALGREGVTARKREGDGATPLGRWRVRHVLYRADRVPRPRTRLPLRRIAPNDGWCDAPGDRNYNRPVPLPYAASAERLFRKDGVYDLVAVLDYNVRPRVKGRGSAIFMHVAQADRAPTEGCVALARSDLLRLLAAFGRGRALCIRR